MVDLARQLRRRQDGATVGLERLPGGRDGHADRAPQRERRHDVGPALLALGLHEDRAVEADARAKREAAEAIVAAERRAKEQAAAEKAEAERREANKQHAAAVNRRRFTEPRPRSPGEMELDRTLAANDLEDVAKELA